MATVLLPGAWGRLARVFLVILFAENGISRAVVESLSGAEAAALAPQGSVGAAPGSPAVLEADRYRALVALLGSWMSEQYGVGAILLPLAIVQGLAVAAALLIHEPDDGRQADGAQATATAAGDFADERQRARRLVPERRGALGLRGGDGPVPRRECTRRRLPGVVPEAGSARAGSDARLCLRREHGGLDARRLAGGLAGRPLRPQAAPDRGLDDHGGPAGPGVPGPQPELAVANQALDGLGNGLFAVLAAAWVTDRLADPRRSGEAQVIVGSCLVFGSAIGPAVSSFLVGPLGYRGLFCPPGRRRSGRDSDRGFLRTGDPREARRVDRRPDRRPDGHDVRPLDRPVIDPRVQCSAVQQGTASKIFTDH